MLGLQRVRLRRGKQGLRRLAVGTGLGLAVLLGFGAVATAQTPNPTMVVNDAGDRDDVAGSDGVCQTSSGTCTLRAAISQANFSNGADRVEFNIPGSQVHRIVLGSPLPYMVDLSGGLTIDGYSQPGSSVNTDPLIFNAVIKIEVDGSGAQTAFTIQSPENTIRGLAIFGSDDKIELINENADGNVIVGNVIGTNLTATVTGGRIGVAMNLGPDQNVIGTPALGDRNVISGNGGQGVRINHGESSQNIIQNNIIGLDATGTVSYPQSIGVDLQFWTWGNLVGGDGANEGNLLSGHNSSGMDLSHSAIGNSVLGNRIGTMADGNSATAVSANGNGVIFKDNPVNNYVANNIISGNRSEGVWHKHNFTGRNTIVNNRIGVGADGSAVGNGDYGIFVTGHDDIYYNNIIANNGAGGVKISNTTTRNNANFPDELTERNSFRLGSLYNNAGPTIEIEGSVEHPSQDGPTITGVGSGEIYGGETCAGCNVDIYASGAINGDGTVTVGPTPGIFLRLSPMHVDACLDVRNNSMADNARLLQDTDCDSDSGQRFSVVPSGTGFAVRNNGSGKCLDVSGRSTANNASVIQLTCNGLANQTLQWSGNSLIFAHSGKCLDFLNGSTANQTWAVQYTCDGRDSQRFHFRDSVDTSWIGSVTADGSGNFSMASSAIQPDMIVMAISITPDGETSEPSGPMPVGTTPYNLGSNPGSPDPAPPAPAALDLPPRYQPDVFECSESNGTLSWSDESASTYYVFATSSGVDTYLGGHSTTSLAVAGADSYRVTHWQTGFATRATCDGPGPDVVPVFSCTAESGALSWDDAGAANYYVFATTAGTDTYLGGFQSTSTTVAGADSYRVTHWLGGKTVATCDGPGPDVVPVFSCTAANGTLSWDDAGAANYYVFATTAGTDTYLGGHQTTSISVTAADSYRVTHWLGGKTVASCDGA